MDDRSQAAGKSQVVAKNAVSVPCEHCGLPSPRPTDPSELPFCCTGCHGAYFLIRDWGLDDYYALRDRLGGQVGSPVDAADDFDALDDPVAMGKSAPMACGDNLLKSRLAVTGLHCGACAWLIERSAKRHKGWVSARVRLSDHTVDVVYAADTTRLSQIARSLSRLGYRLSPLVENAQQERDARQNRTLLIDIAIAGFCAANAMWIAIALYAGMFSGIADQHANVLRWTGVTLGLAAVVIPGRTFFRGARASIATRTPHMDLPVALGLAVGATAGIVSAASGGSDVYFDSIATLVFLLLVGRWVQFRQQRRAAESVSLLMRLTPRTAKVVVDNKTTKTVLAESLTAGDVIRIGAGETIPADGTVVAGQTSIDRSLVSGESRPAAVTVDDEVLAGCSNLESQIDVCVTASGRASRVGQIAQLIEDASSQRVPVIQLADSIGGVFVVTVIGLALVTLGIWWTTDPYQASRNAVALLIVACPCALALATPLALSVAIGRAASRRILVRGGDVLERLSRPGTVWFDKTGTLTEGVLRLTHWTGHDTALAMLASIETGSRHPIATAAIFAAEERGLTIPVATEIRQVTGSGLTGYVDGIHVIVGKPAFAVASGAVLSSFDQRTIDQITAAGQSPLVVFIDGESVAIGGFGDQIRNDAAETLRRLRLAGWSVGILSGDHPATVQHVGHQLGFDDEQIIGGAEPEEKLAVVRDSPVTPVVMVGDGVNDSAALAAADVGIAVRGGVAASLEAAPVYLPTGQLPLVCDLMAASRRTRNVIRLNFGLSLGYNVLAVVLAMTGLINPLVAAILMPISSLTVLSVVLALPTFVDDETTPAAP